MTVIPDQPQGVIMDSTVVEIVFFAARKATLAFLVAAGGSIGTAMLAGTVTGNDWVTALGVGVLAAVAIYNVGNKPRV